MRPSCTDMPRSEDFSFSPRLSSSSGVSPPVLLVCSLRLSFPGAGRIWLYDIKRVIGSSLALSRSIIEAKAKESRGSEDFQYTVYHLLPFFLRAVLLLLIFLLTKAGLLGHAKV